MATASLSLSGSASGQSSPAPHSSQKNGLFREVLFSPGNITERKSSYDRYESLSRHPSNPVFTAQAAWEYAGIHWGSVFRSSLDGKFKFFYGTSFPRPQEGVVVIDNSEQGKHECVVCYAESDDGLVWRRPSLNRHFKDKFPGNNIVLTWNSYYNDSSTVIEDLFEKDLSRRYKMMLFHLDVKDRSLTGNCLLTSPDGISWTFTGLVLPGQDASSLWQDPQTGRYYAFLKDRLGSNRSRLQMESDDFINWSEPQWIFTPDHGDHVGTNFYNQSAFLLAGRAMGFLNIYDLTSQTAWIELIESGDRHQWKRMPARPRILPAGEPGSYDGGGAYVGLAEPISMGDEFWYYYYASGDRHDEAAQSINLKLKASLAVATFRKNRLVGQQTENDGFFSTLPFICPGGRLYLNLVSREPVRVAIRTWGYGADYAGFTLEDCIPVQGDQQQAEIRWRGKPTLDELKGKYIKIKVSGRNTIAYSAEFRA